MSLIRRPSSLPVASAGLALLLLGTGPACAAPDVVRDALRPAFSDGETASPGALGLVPAAHDGSGPVGPGIVRASALSLGLLCGLATLAAAVGRRRRFGAAAALRESAATAESAGGAVLDRPALLTELDERLRRAGPGGLLTAVCAFALDGPGVADDTHDRAAAVRLGALAVPGDLVGRFGPGTLLFARGGLRSEDRARALAAHLLDGVAGPAARPGLPRPVAAGLAVASGTARNAAALVDAAILAAREGRGAGGPGTAALHTPPIEAHRLEIDGEESTGPAGDAPVAEPALREALGGTAALSGPGGASGPGTLAHEPSDRPTVDPAAVAELSSQGAAALDALRTLASLCRGGSAETPAAATTRGKPDAEASGYGSTPSVVDAARAVRIAQAARPSYTFKGRFGASAA